MAEELENHDMGGCEDLQPQQTREKKINKKALGELKANGRILKVFVKDPKTGAQNEAESLSIVPLEVATVCSDLICKVSKKTGCFFADGNYDLAAYKYVFDWMKQCGDERNVAAVPELGALVNDEADVKLVVDSMVVAKRLQIPHASFNKFVARKLRDLAKTHLVDLNTVKKAFDTCDNDYSDLGLQAFCVKSIFEAWYSYKLDAQEYLDYVCELSELRENISQLDEDLHNQVHEKDQALRDARARRNAKPQENDYTEAETGDGVARDWASHRSDAVGGNGEWRASENDTSTAWENEASHESAGVSWAYGAAAKKGEKIDWASEVETAADLAPITLVGGLG